MSVWDEAVDGEKLFVLNHDDRPQELKELEWVYTTTIRSQQQQECVSKLLNRHPAPWKVEFDGVEQVMVDGRGDAISLYSVVDAMNGGGE